MPEPAKSNAKAVRQLEDILGKLERMDYYQILGVQPEAEVREIRRRFYERSKKYHPDRYHYVKDRGFHRLVTSVYKQISEAYNVLKDPKTRRAYDEGLREDRAANLRFNPQREQERKKPFDGGSGPGAKYYKMAQQALVARNIGSARNNIKLALTMEPKNEQFEALKSEIEAKA